MTVGYFITGTDTNVGKTYVGAHLARRAVQRGHRVFAFKPIESGCTNPLGEDQRLLVEAAGNWQTQALRGVYQLPLPAAPLVAAQAAAARIEPAEIRRAYDSGRAQATFTIVEGAGGWRVPITETLDMGGLAASLALPVLLVARATLGTINHTLLSAEAITRDGCQLAAVILSQQPNDDTSLLESNILQISRFLPRVIVLANDPMVLDSLLPT